MNIASIRPGTIEAEILNPRNAEATGLVITLKSKISDEFIDAKRAIVDEINAKNGEKLTRREEEEHDIKLLQAVVCGWRWEGDANWNGDKLEFTTANVRTVLLHPWLRNQLFVRLERVSDFFPE